MPHDHDLTAELAAYRDEHTNLTAAGKGERAALVAEEVTRVEKAISDRADELDAESKSHLESGADGVAGQLAVQARELRAALRPLEDAAQSAPRERAVPKRKSAE